MFKVTPLVGFGAAGGISTPVSIGAVSQAPGATNTLTTTAAIPSGALVVVGIGGAHAGTSITVSSVSDGTNSYTLAVRAPWNAGSGVLGEIWYKSSAAGLPTASTITVTWSASADTFNVGIAAAYVTGAPTLDKTAQATGGSSTTPASGSSGTLSTPLEAAFGFVYGAPGASITEDANFVRLSAVPGGGCSDLAYKLTSATTALNYQPTFASTTFWADLLATFR